MRPFSLRLTHKITAIGVIGVIGVVLIGSIHLYGEKAMAVYRDAGHITDTYATFLAPLVEPLLKSIAKTNVSK